MTEHEGVEGQVVSYTPDPRRHDPRWCIEGTAISDHMGTFKDTYWASGLEAHVLNDVELPTIKHLFWLDEFRELDRYSRDAPAEWLTYAREDRQRVTSQHGLQSRWLVRVGAKPDLPTQIENAIESLRSAEYDLEAARRRVEAAEERVDELRDRQRGG